MKKRKRNISIQFWVTPTENRKIYENMERSGMENLSEFLRILALSDVEVNFSVRLPNILHASDARLVEAEKPQTVESKDQKRVAG